MGDSPARCLRDRRAHRLGCGTVRQAEDGNRGTAGQFGDVVDEHRTCWIPAAASGVVSQDFVAGIDQVRGKFLSHVAEPDEADDSSHGTTLTDSEQAFKSMEQGLWQETIESSNFLQAEELIGALWCYSARQADSVGSVQSFVVRS